MLSGQEDFHTRSPARNRPETAEPSLQGLRMQDRREEAERKAKRAAEDAVRGGKVVLQPRFVHS